MKKVSLLVLCGLICVLSIFAQQEDRLFREAERRFQKGDYQFAYSRYEQLLDEFPDSAYAADARFRQAVILTYLGRSNEALEMFIRISERYPNTRFYRYIPFWRGYNHFRLDEYAAALDFFNAYIGEGREKDSGDSLYRDALLYKAMCERELQDREQALVTVKRLYGLYDSPVEAPGALMLYSSLLVETGRFEELYDLFADIPFGLMDGEYRRRLSLYRAEALFREGRTGEAEQLFLDLLDTDGEIQTTAYKRLFVIYGQTGQAGKQQEIFDEAQNSLADRPVLLAEFLLRAGIQQYREGMYELSRSYLRRIWRTVPTEEIDGLVPYYLALISERNGDIDEAVQLIEGYMAESDSRRGDLLFTLGRLESTRGNWNRAAGIMEQFLGEFPDSVHRDAAHYIYAHSLYRSGMYREALAVVQDSFAEGEGAAYDRELLRLRARLYTELNQTEQAVQDLREYLPRYPGDIDAYVDLVKLYFERGEYGKLHLAVDEALAVAPGEDQNAELLKLKYMDGMAHMKQGRYADAAEVFSRIESSDMRTAGLDELVPHFLFYNGWIHYTQGDYAESTEWFAQLIEEYPDSVRTDEAVYLNGWAAYAGGDYVLAQRSFGDYSRRDLPEDEKVRGLFMYAKSSSAIGKSEDALLMYRTLYTDYPGSSLADDALFEYAALLYALGKIPEAARTYYSVYTTYPTSPLGEEALFRRGDLLYRAGDYREARDAFYEHRVRYPRGSLVDVSLYWSGHSALNIGQPYGAVLVWEKLAEQYSDSSFYTETLLELARLYTELGEYQKSVSAYSRYLASNPAEEAGREARVQIDTLKRIIAGQNTREAELTVQLERYGLKEKQGREAALELARLYLYQYPEKTGEAYDLLRRLKETEGLERNTAAQAEYLTGEYFRKKSQYGKAASAYARAAVAGAGDDDLVARSLLKAAESAEEAGDFRTARQMVQKLKADFPHTQWVIEGESLLDRIERKD